MLGHVAGAAWVPSLPRSWQSRGPGCRSRGSPSPSPSQGSRCVYTPLPGHLSLNSFLWDQLCLPDPRATSQPREGFPVPSPHPAGPCTAQHPAPRQPPLGMCMSPASTPRRSWSRLHGAGGAAWGSCSTGGAVGHGGSGAGADPPDGVGGGCGRCGTDPSTQPGVSQRVPRNRLRELFREAPVAPGIAAACQGAALCSLLLGLGRGHTRPCHSPTPPSWAPPPPGPPLWGP